MGVGPLAAAFRYALLISYCTGITADNPLMRTCEECAAYLRAHQSYLAERDEIESLGTDFTGGGMPDRVKCLHVLIAHSLAKGPGVNPLGDESVALAAENSLRGKAIPADWPTIEELRAEKQ